MASDIFVSVQICSIMKYLQIFALSVCAAVVAVSCSKGGGGGASGGSGQYMEVPGYGKDVWVTDSDILESDLDYLMDLSVKMEFMRLEMIRMLSNNFEGDRLFCGTGDKSDPDPTVKCFTRLMSHEEEYQAALDRLGLTNLMTPTTKMDLGLSKIKNIFKAGWEEGKRAQEEIQDNLMHMRSGYDQTAQQQLYDFYVEMEPEHAKAIGAKDARDFFQKLNSGELNAYTVNISHIWRDMGIRKSGETGNRVGDYAETAFTGDLSYLKAAYRVSSTVAVNLGEMYLSGIDNMAGGYGSKIIELGETIQNKIKALELAAKALQGKPDWQGMNSFLVNSIMSDVKDAVGDALGGDNSNFGQQFIKETAEILADKIVEMATEQKSEEAGADNQEAGQVEKGIKDDRIAVLEIYTEPGTLTPKMIIITDDNTGTMSMARPNADGRLSIATTPGSKTLTVMRSDGKRLTKRITAKEGFNTVALYFGQAPYIGTNYEKIFLSNDDTYATGSVLTNCRYVRIFYPQNQNWFEVNLQTYGEFMEFVVKSKLNDTGEDRYGTFTLQGFESTNFFNSTPVATFIVTVRQYAAPEASEGSISTNNLVFDAAGGTQSVTLKPGSYTRYGYTIKKEYKDWISASLEDGCSIAITVKPNTTGQEREGLVECFLTNEESPTDEDKAIFPVTIKQKASSAGGGVFCGIYASYYLEDANTTYSSSDNNGTSHHTESFMTNFEKMMVSVSVQNIQGGLILSAHQKYTKEYSYEEPFIGTFTRDIKVTLKASDINDPQTYVIQSAEFEYTVDEAPEASPEKIAHFYNRYSFSGANIPLSKKNKGCYEYQLKGDSFTTGISFSGETGCDYSGGWYKTVLNSYSANSKNSVKVELYTE